MVMPCLMPQCTWAARTLPGINSAEDLPGARVTRTQVGARMAIPPCVPPLADGRAGAQRPAKPARTA
eukprot:5647189-Pyramimonas_sp.AAC.1